MVHFRGLGFSSTLMECLGDKLAKDPRRRQTLGALVSGGRDHDAHDASSHPTLQGGWAGEDVRSMYRLEGLNIGVGGRLVHDKHQVFLSCVGPTTSCMSQILTSVFRSVFEPSSTSPFF